MARDFLRPSSSLESLRENWLRVWPDAIADWSPFVQLHEPVWCMTVGDEIKESLSESFAMIRLVDHTVVISLRRIRDQGLDDFGCEILAHEVGHHVYCPADLTDNARLLARMRRGLPGCEAFAPMVANLYADLLINDRLQRSCGRNMSGVYQAIGSDTGGSDLWNLYMRTYEILWSLTGGTLARKDLTPRTNQDAVLGARLVRSYARDWLAGAGRFACLCLPYIAEEQELARKAAGLWCDAVQAGIHGIPDGLTEVDDDELSGILHPSEDPGLSGLDPIENPAQGVHGPVSSELSGRKSIKSFRDPFEYAEILTASGSTLNEREIAERYYRERALPHLIPFPSRTKPVATDPIPEGIDIWDPASEIDRVDWFETMVASPQVIPGITTRERLHGCTPGSDPEHRPFDLYLGVDCSGSMRDPARTLSYPVLAGAVMALSALRAGAKVKVVLSGEPGRSVSTDGFVRDQHQVLKTLVNYLGTGYSFGIHRLAETFSTSETFKNPVHILIVSDYDMFAMLNEKANHRLGWDVAREAAEICHGGATYVLQLPGYSPSNSPDQARAIDRMTADGWEVFLVNCMEELVDFARRFSRTYYQRVPKRGEVPQRKGPSSVARS